MLPTLQNVQTPSARPENISILLVSPHNEDDTVLRHLLRDSGCEINRCRSKREAAALVGTRVPSLIICERDLPDGTWKDVLGQADALPNRPLVLVVSRHADESLWGEVLNLGGYDVLLKPFDRVEVTRVVEMAWRQWFQPADLRRAQPVV
jgi:response regulator RpfG family c-di-GMP phosphodiesterase